MAYPDWFAGQHQNIQREILGPGRFKLWKAGEVSIKGFVNDGRIIPLKELVKAA